MVSYTHYLVSESVFYALYRVKKCLLDSLSVLSEVVQAEIVDLTTGLQQVRAGGPSSPNSAGLESIVGSCFFEKRRLDRLEGGSDSGSAAVSVPSLC